MIPRLWIDLIASRYCTWSYEPLAMCYMMKLSHTYYLLSKKHHICIAGHSQPDVLISGPYAWEHSDTKTSYEDVSDA
jgi:hypothetical protein